MKTSLERTVQFGEEYDQIHSVECNDSHVSLSRWIDEKRYESAITMNWEAWDRLTAEVNLYRALKAQSEAA